MGCATTARLAGIVLLATQATAAAVPAPDAPPPSASSAAPTRPATLTAVPVALPGASAGVGFDDLAFLSVQRKVLVPGGRTGSLYLVDPATREVEAWGGFSAKDKADGGHGDGITSADSGHGWIFATDRTALLLDVVDPSAKQIVSSVRLAGGPDYVRYVEPTGEVWVTEPAEDRIEIFTLPSGNAPVPTHAAFVEVPGGPESLVIDATRGRAYTNLWKDATLAIDLRSHASIAHWPNGCAGSRGLALDGKRGFLFVGCSEGKASVLDIDHEGKVLDTLAHGSGVDIVAFEPRLSHLYLPGGKSGSMAILGVAASGKLSLLGTVKTAAGSHCVVSDDRRQAWVCDPRGGRLLLVADTLPPGGS